jgi:hypothetical protein
MKRAIVLLIPLAAACSTPQNPELDFANRDRVSPQTPDARYSARAQKEGTQRQAKGAPPPMDPARKVSEQDCSGPVVPDQGNLRCI